MLQVCKDDGKHNSLKKKRQNDNRKGRNRVLLLQFSNLKYYTLVINAELLNGFRQEAFNLA